MVSRKVTIVNMTGLHLRPTKNLCQEAVLFKSSVTFVFHGTEVNAKSVLSVLGAGVNRGDEILLQCRGEDEEEALEKLAAYIENGLGTD